MSDLVGLFDTNEDSREDTVEKIQSAGFDSSDRFAELGILTIAESIIDDVREYSDIFEDSSAPPVIFSVDVYHRVLLVESALEGDNRVLLMKPDSAWDGMSLTFYSAMKDDPISKPDKIERVEISSNAGNNGHNRSEDWVSVLKDTVESSMGTVFLK